MNGQVSSSGSSAGKWLFFGFMLAVMMAMLVGMNFRDATWLNPNISNAEKNRMEIDSAHQEALYRLDEQLAQAKTQAEIDAIQRERQLLNQKAAYNMVVMAQDLKHREILFDTLMIAVQLIAFGIFAAILLGTVLWVGSKVLSRVLTDQGRGGVVNHVNGHNIKHAYYTHPLINISSRENNNDQFGDAKKNGREKANPAKELILKPYTDPSRITDDDYYYYPQADE